ncbi:hypothetical protein [Streptomyces sp. NPDC057253]|uniref:hypothetical protein n=1 Tax=Streptomyces sp. NPDC057253 TaxID=3346069 RepID=UPI003627B884
MTLVAGVGDTGAIPVLRAADFSRRGPYVRNGEDVPHEGSIPDLYGLAADEALEEAIEDGRLRWSINLMTGETVLSVRTDKSNV